MTSKSIDSQRFHGLDSLRAVAMLLGVLYHSLVFGMMVGGTPGTGPMGQDDSSRYLGDWLHSFRMPLFFLISGFFGRMMLEKYGTATYLKKRWYRIGIPLVIGMFTFGPVYILTRDALSSNMGRPGAATMPFGDGELPPPPPGFVPPPLVRFDENSDGSLDGEEWKQAQVELKKMFSGGGPPGFGPGGPGGGGPPGFGPGGPGGGGPPGFGPGGPGGGGPGVSMLLFGSNSRYFELHHLWFLWYLLVFVTVTPFVAGIFNILFHPISDEADRLASRMIQSGLAPVLFGLTIAPVLMVLPSMFGWSLGLAPAIFRAFPDFLYHLDPEMGFYYLYFLAGWLLHRERESLPALAQTWIPQLVLGLLEFGTAIWLSDRYRSQTTLYLFPLIRWASYSLYSIGGATTCFAFLGFFQKYLDRPGRSLRYLADTALWIYLIHQPLVLLGLAWLQPYRLPWWVLASAVTLLSVTVSLVLYEALVRPTILARWFGPAGARPNEITVVRSDSTSLISESSCR